MRAYDLIKQKRDGGSLDPRDIAEFLAGVTSGKVPDYQTAALLMAIVFRGLNEVELTAWTEAMLRSGRVLDLSEIPGQKIDKHSTGGVGDKVTICLAPLVAACGVPVPMVSGRGLGHTGGTLDKLRSIPGFEVDLPVARFRELVGSVGACLIGQTDEIAPADRRLYALRDVTATVESIPLIAASIMSKKMAEGIDGLVLDVKVGRGAFMKTEAEARKLTLAMIGIGEAMGKRISALLTDMDQPLGRAVGNVLEVREAVEMLEDQGPADLRELTLLLAAEMLVLGGVAADLSAARGVAEAAVRDGRALRKLGQIVEAQGGDPRVLEAGGSGLAQAPEQVPFLAARSGVIVGLDAEKVGRAAMALGAGRATLDDVIDPAVGLSLLKKRGDQVAASEPLCVLHIRNKRGLPEARALLGQAYEISRNADLLPPAPPLVLGRYEAGEEIVP